MTRDKPGLSQCVLCARYFQGETQEQAEAESKACENKDMADFRKRMQERGLDNGTVH